MLSLKGIPSLIITRTNLIQNEIIWNLKKGYLREYIDLSSYKIHSILRRCFTHKWIIMLLRRTTIFISFNKYIFNSGPNCNMLPGMCPFYQGKRRLTLAGKDHNATNYFDMLLGKVCDLKIFYCKKFMLKYS